MSSASVSFRISHNTENLAETIHLLSQRLVSLEHRLHELENNLSHSQLEDPGELARLDNVERLLQDCRQLLNQQSLQADDCLAESARSQQRAAS